MKSATAVHPLSPATVAIHVTEAEQRVPRGVTRCEIGAQIKFSTGRIESYFFAKWEPVAWDLLLLAAAVEFADRMKRRPAYGWRRSFSLRIPVHSPRLWSSSEVESSLRGALELLTGDEWHFNFVARRKDVARPNQAQFSLDPQVEAVIPFSNGLDSYAVAGLMERRMGNRLVRIRLGSGFQDGKAFSRRKEAFTRIPYAVSPGNKSFVESSARSRGFKFAVISGIAAFLSNAGTIIVPESGQGSLGPSLTTVGQASEDYRSHPLFTRRMELFFDALLGHTVTYEFPQLWKTKAETLRQFVDENANSVWQRTRSCWQQNRQSSVDEKWRHCGICAACMLRRLSVHAAGLTEPNENYVWEDLSARTFESGAVASFDKSKITPAMREYAIAGTLHFDHLAGLLRSPANATTLEVTAFQLREALHMPKIETRQRLNRLLEQHSREWEEFLISLGTDSFIRHWAPGARS